MLSQHERRRHPLLPTLPEIQSKVAPVYSDHLLMLTSVPLTHNSCLNILSLNMLGPSAPSGLHASSQHQPEANAILWETLEEVRSRYDRLICGVMRAKIDHHVDMICLQAARSEFFSDEILLEKKLMEGWRFNLKKGWRLYKDDFGLITCYNAKRFRNMATSVDNKNRIRSIKLQDKNNMVIVEVFHVFGYYNIFPHQVESHYRSLLDNSASNTAVLIGNTHARIAPINNKLANITTCILPVAMNDLYGYPRDAQVPDFPDGGFYRDMEGDIFQLETQVLRRLKLLSIVEQKN